MSRAGTRARPTLGRGIKAAILVVSLLAAALVPPSLAAAAVTSCDGEPLTKPAGGDAADSITGTSGNDVLAGGGGNDTIVGLGGDDLICGGTGADTIQGSGGADNLLGESGNDLLQGGAENDLLLGGAGNDTIEGQSGNFDLAVFFDSPHSITANLQAGTATGLGSDTMNGVEGLAGSPQGDSLIGNSLDNFILGYLGNDTINGGGGTLDVIGFLTPTSGPVVDLAQKTSSGEGADSISNAEGVFGSSLNDTIRGDRKANFLVGLEGNDALLGASGNDWLFGFGGNDSLEGQAGEDLVEGGAGTDTLDGGSGLNDAASWIFSSAPITASLTSGTASGDGPDSMVSVEQLVGSSQNDWLVGSDSANSIWGAAGNDTLSGRGGRDALNGGPGTDSATGGAGQDLCVDAETNDCEVVPVVPGTGAAAAGPPRGSPWRHAAERLTRAIPRPASASSVESGSPNSSHVAGSTHVSSPSVHTPQTNRSQRQGVEGVASVSRGAFYGTTDVYCGFYSPRSTVSMPVGVQALNNTAGFDSQTLFFRALVYVPAVSNQPIYISEWFWTSVDESTNSTQFWTRYNTGETADWTWPADTWPGYTTYVVADVYWRQDGFEDYNYWYRATHRERIYNTVSDRCHFEKLTNDPLTPWTQGHTWLDFDLGPIRF